MKTKKKTLLWKISLPNTQLDSYMLGTIHAHNNVGNSKLDSYKKIIQATNQFWAEINLNQPNEDNSFLMGKESIPMLIGDRKFNKLKNIFRKRLGLDISPFKNFKPIILVNIIGEYIIGEKKLINLDRELWEFAQVSNKKMNGIEDMNAHFKVLDKIPIKEQVKQLLDISTNIGKYRKKLDSVMKIYDEGDFNKLLMVSKKGMGKSRKFMLVDRNYIIADKIFNNIETDTHFFTFGAGHLGGEFGVLRILKKKGVILTPLKF